MTNKNKKLSSEKNLETKSSNTLFSVRIPTYSKKDILEYVKKWVKKTSDFKHIVSLNPEILVQSSSDPEFKEVLQNADLALIDGIGIKIAGAVRGIPVGERFAGADFMTEVLDALADRSLRVLFLGGKPELADKLAECYSQKYTNMEFSGITGSKDIRSDRDSSDTRHILEYIQVWKPHLIFVSFGSPEQEKWLWRNREHLKGIVCAGVGGAFDFAAGVVPRAPHAFRAIGMEWFYRLVKQPWRWRRQLRLPLFLWLVITKQDR